MLIPVIAVGVLSFSEDSSANPHNGSALFNGSFQISAHAHAECIRTFWQQPLLQGLIADLTQQPERRPYS
ncbi:MAG: hypothetical protein ACTHMC_03670 [Pseudobacter sp.]|uniref:hypothetical protein n=1 Tax=Pseudobacter sp. TaxID=2045420 RepID=UPI003F7DA2E6